jgi:hypothetical protein
MGEEAGVEDSGRLWTIAVIVLARSLVMPRNFFGVTQDQQLQRLAYILDAELKRPRQDRDSAGEPGTANGL